MEQRTRNSLVKTLVCGFFLLLLTAHPVWAQEDDDERRVVQFTGLIVEGDSMYGVPFVHAYVPNTPRGAITNTYGYFSMAVYEEDSVVFDIIGYQNESYKIPKGADENLSVIVHLVPDTVVLAEVEIYPYPNLREFTQAFLALELPRQRDIDNMYNNLNERVMQRILYHTGADGSMNHRYFMEQQVTRAELRYIDPRGRLSLLDPFAWARFFKDLKSYKKKKDAGLYDYLDDEE